MASISDGGAQTPGLFGEHSPEQAVSQSAHSWLVTAAAKGVAHGIQFVALIVLARLLAPADFGVLSMVMSVIGIATIFRDLGLSAATVRQPAITHEQVSTLFWINGGLGVLMVLLGCAVAPLLQSFYDDPRVLWVTVALSVNFLLNGFGAQHQALLQRNLRFKNLAWVSVLTSLTANAIAVVLALQGATYWALVAASLVEACTRTVLVWRFCRWLPGRPHFDAAIRKMISFGGYLVVFSLFGYLATNMHNILIGWSGGAAAVGLYSRAHLFLTMLLAYVMEPLGLIVPATLSRLQAQPALFSRYYLKMIAAMTAITAPIGFICLIQAEDIIRLLLGGQWQGSIVILQLLAISAVPQTLCYTTGWIYLARGDSRTMMRWGIGGWSLVLICILLGLPYGIKGVATAYSVSMFLLFWPCMAVAFRGTGISMAQLIAAFYRPLAAAGLAALLLWGLYFWLPADIAPLLRLTITLPVYLAVYAALVLFVFGQRELVLEFINQLRQRRRAAA
ncbi:MAG: lipopolysaccharide biosynthesis protein [Nevskiales bacterium]